MDLSKLRAQLVVDEGCHATAYPDALTGGDPWTIGIGHTGPEVHKGLVWTAAQIDDAYGRDVQGAYLGLDRITPWWRGLDTVRQNVLMNMGFNLGAPRLSGFKRMLRAAAVGDWNTAAMEMMDSDWAKQVGDRATRLEKQMLTGEW